MSDQDKGAPLPSGAFVNGDACISACPIPSVWTVWVTDPPSVGWKVVIVCNDGCSSSLALMTDEGPLDGEDGMSLTDEFLAGAIWTRLPDNYPLYFMELTDADWY